MLLLVIDIIVFEKNVKFCLPQNTFPANLASINGLYLLPLEQVLWTTSVLSGKRKKNTVKVQDSVYLSTHTKIETELSRCRTLGR